MHTIIPSLVKCGYQAISCFTSPWRSNNYVNPRETIQTQSFVTKFDISFSNIIILSIEIVRQRYRALFSKQVFVYSLGDSSMESITSLRPNIINQRSLRHYFWAKMMRVQRHKINCFLLLHLIFSIPEKQQPQIDLVRTSLKLMPIKHDCDLIIECNFHCIKSRFIVTD